uniref:Uncharacterized protein n=1 Tax=Rhizophora mucronata TaxID=61149 RepID=A0A2P2JDE7_RHIMU
MRDYALILHSFKFIRTIKLTMSGY